MIRIMGSRADSALDPGRPEDFVQPFYDRVNIATTVPSSVSMFSIAIGNSATLITGTSAASKTKTKRDTNMENSGVVPSKALSVRGFSLMIVHSNRSAITNNADRQYVLDGGAFKFRIGDKDILDLPLLAFPIINDFTGMATTATDTSANAYGSLKAPMFKISPQYMAPNTNFSVTLTYDGTITLSNTLDLYVFMWSGMRRPS